jgi:hypothetical protein
MNDFLKMLFEDEDKFVLQVVCKEYPDIASRVEELLSKKLSEVDIEQMEN